MLSPVGRLFCLALTGDEESHPGSFLQGYEQVGDSTLWNLASQEESASIVGATL